MATTETKTFAIVDNGAERFVERKIVPVVSSEQVLGLMLVFYDRTDQRELERSRQELSNMIVHDLRSPLTAVMTSLRLLQDMVPQIARLGQPCSLHRRQPPGRQEILNRVNSYSISQRCRAVASLLRANRSPLTA